MGIIIGLLTILAGSIGIAMDKRWGEYVFFAGAVITMASIFSQ